MVGCFWFFLLLEIRVEFLPGFVGFFSLKLHDFCAVGKEICSTYAMMPMFFLILVYYLKNSHSFQLQ